MDIHTAEELVLSGVEGHRDRGDEKENVVKYTPDTDITSCTER